MKKLFNILFKQRRNFIVQQGSGTIRLMPENYWVASIENLRLKFDSWDGCTNEMFQDGRLTRHSVRRFYKKYVTG